MPEPITAVIFDIGGVLLDWNPRHLYRSLFDDEAEMERFLSEVCTLRWHAAHDLGIPYETTCAELAERHPHYAEMIWAWGRRTEEMVAGPIDGTVEILRALVDAGVPCFGLTNMEATTYPRRVKRWEFMRWFSGTVVSAHEGIAKPDAEIFQRLLNRYALRAGATAFIDDSPVNVAAAADLGLRAHRFQGAAELDDWLRREGVLGAVDAAPVRCDTGQAMTEDHTAVVRRGFSAALEGDLELLGEILHPDVTWHGGDPGSGCVGRRQVLSFMRNAVARGGGSLREGPAPQLVDVIPAGDRVVVLIAPDGDPEAELRANVTTFRDGKVIEILAQESPEAAFSLVGLDASAR